MIVLDVDEELPGLSNMYLNNKAQPQLYIRLIKSNLNRFDKERFRLGLLILPQIMNVVLSIMKPKSLQNTLGM